MKRRYVHGEAVCAGTCRRLTRPAGSLVGDYPHGMVLRHPQGMCRGCYRRNGEPAIRLRQDIPPEQVRYIRRELIDYYRSRGRDIPTELLEAS